MSCKFNDLVVIMLVALLLPCYGSAL